MIISRGGCMPLYEVVFIARSDISQQQVDTIVDGIVAQAETDGAVVRKREYWGLRNLVYRIKKNRKGHYVLLGLEAGVSFIKEIERQLFLNADILRLLILRVENIDDTPSPILSRKGEERGEHTHFRSKKPVKGGRFESGRRSIEGGHSDHVGLVHSGEE